MKIETTRSNKAFTVLDKDTLILKGRRPKWYSSEIRFFHNSKTYEIKKKDFGVLLLLFWKVVTPLETSIGA